MKPEDIQRLYDLAGPLGPLVSFEDFTAATDAWVDQRTLEDVPDMLGALAGAPERWVEDVAVTVGLALTRIAKDSPEGLAPVLAQAARQPGLAGQTAIEAIADLPDPLALDLLFGLDVTLLYEEGQRAWIGALSENGDPRAAARLRSVAEDPSSPPAARREAQTVLDLRKED